MAARPAREGRRVAVLCKSLPQYRTQFFELLRARLAEDGIELVVLYGEPARAEASRRDSGALAWGHPLTNRPIRLGRREVIWQSAGTTDLRRVDLVIVEQASKLLLNYVLQVRYWCGGPRFAFWGHGRNFQTRSASGFGERIKRFVSRRAHWWFAYNDASAAIVAELGVPADRITSVQNAIDTRELRLAREAATPDMQARAREELRLEGANVCLYAGALYREKRIEYLLEAAVRIRERVRDFELIVMGDGPDAGVVRAAAATHDWIKYVGPAFGREKAILFSLAKLFLLPGAVGLAVLDAFALEVPLVTTAASDHGPEIDYLRNGQNGLIVPGDPTPNDFAAAVVDLLENDAERMRLRRGCREAAVDYTVEHMVERFAEGVRKALT